MVADYTFKLPDKNLLRAKLHEIAMFTESEKDYMEKDSPR